jgi:hypothetical protein
MKSQHLISDVIPSFILHTVLVGRTTLMNALKWLCIRVLSPARCVPGFGSTIYSVGSDEIAEFTGNESHIRSADVLDGTTEVAGPLLNDEGRQIHQEYDW